MKDETAFAIFVIFYIIGWFLFLRKASFTWGDIFSWEVLSLFVQLTVIFPIGLFAAIMGYFCSKDTK